MSVDAFRTQNFYSMLKVDKNATPAVIRRAYYALCLKHHPDRHQDQDKKKDAAERFQCITAAYETLSDPVRRHLYDSGGEEKAHKPADTQQTGTAQQALPTGDKAFVAMDLALKFRDFLPLFEILPSIERKHGLELGELQMDIPGFQDAPPACTGAADCDLRPVTHPRENIPLSLCLTHKLLHQHTLACHNANKACMLLARSLQHQWREDVNSNWVVHESSEDDPVRPSYPYWFNSRNGVSEWCKDKQERDSTPPQWTTQDHTCTKETCEASGFVRIMDNIWVCRRTSTLHLCTPTQCTFREPAPSVVSNRLAGIPAQQQQQQQQQLAFPAQHRTFKAKPKRKHSASQQQQQQQQQQEEEGKQDKGERTKVSALDRLSDASKDVTPSSSATQTPKEQQQQQQQQQQRKQEAKSKPQEAAVERAPSHRPTVRGAAVYCWATRLLFNEDSQDALLDATGRQFSLSGTDSELRLIEYKIPATGERVRKVIERPAGSNVGRRVHMEGGMPVIPTTPQSDNASPSHPYHQGDRTPVYGYRTPEYGSESPQYQSALEYIAGLERRAAHVAKREADELYAYGERKQRELKEQGWDSPTETSNAQWENLAKAFAATPAHVAAEMPMQGFASPTESAMTEMGLPDDYQASSDEEGEEEEEEEEEEEAKEEEVKEEQQPVAKKARMQVKEEEKAEEEEEEEKKKEKKKKTKNKKNQRKKESEEEGKEKKPKEEEGEGGESKSLENAASSSVVKKEQASSEPPAKRAKTTAAGAGGLEEEEALGQAGARRKAPKAGKGVLQKATRTMHAAERLLKQRVFTTAQLHTRSQANNEDTVEEPTDFYTQYVNPALDGPDHEPEALGDYMTLRTGEKNFNAVEDDEEERADEVRQHQLDTEAALAVEDYESKYGIAPLYDETAGTPAVTEALPLAIRTVAARHPEMRLRVCDGKVFRVLEKPPTTRPQDLPPAAGVPQGRLLPSRVPVVNPHARIRGMPPEMAAARWRSAQPRWRLQETRDGGDGGGDGDGDDVRGTDSGLESQVPTPRP